MSTYEYLKGELTKQKTDLMFKPERLDELSDTERKEIELLIVEECKRGNITSFPYIPYLKTVVVNADIPRDVIRNFPDLQKAQICRYMFKATKLYLYVDLILEVADHSPEAFSILIQMYKEMEEGRVKAQTGKQLKRIQETNGAVYKALYDKFIGSVDLQKADVPKPTVPEEKKQLLEHMKAYRDRILSRFKVEESEKRLDMRSALYGFIVGDAFGVPVEFESRAALYNKPATQMLEFGSHKVPKGTWSDDSSMTLATMDSISSKGTIDYEDMMHRFIAWSEQAEYTATDSVFDIGITTSSALRYYMYNGKPALESGLTDVRSNGNGSLMRILPACLYVYSLVPEEDKKVEIINNVSSLTHAHEISKMGCYIYYKFMESLLGGNNKETAYQDICKVDYSKYYSPETINVYKRILDGNLMNISIDQISSSGYVVSTLEAVLWTILNTKDYREAIIRSVNLGEDTDTVGAITGSLAGMIYGYETIPKEWLEVIPKQDYLNSLIDEFNAQILNKPNAKSIKL